MLRETAVICNYCGKQAEKIKRKKHWETEFNYSYRCEDCDAHVRCHDNGEPMGTLAKPELRKKRSRVHQWLDPIWQSGKRPRPACYRDLSVAMKLSLEQTHIGMFDEAQCEQAIAFLRKYKKKVDREEKKKRFITKSKAKKIRKRRKAP